MSDKENTSAVTQSDAGNTPAASHSPQPAAASVAGASATNVNQIDVHVTVQAPRAATGGHRQPRRTSDENGRAASPSSPPHGNRGVRGAPVASNGVSATPTSAAGVSQSYDRDGNLQRTISDGLGGRVILTTDDGVTHASYSDRSGLLMTHSDRGGFTEFATERYTQAGEPRTRSTINRATEGLDGIYGFRPDVSCGGRGSVAATNAVVDSVTRNEIQEFFNRHPSIKETLRGLNLPIVELNGQPATTASVLSQPSNFHACPVGRTDLTVERIR